MDPTQMELDHLRHMKKHLHDFIKSAGLEAAFKTYLVNIEQEGILEKDLFYSGEGFEAYKDSFNPAEELGEVSDRHAVPQEGSVNVDQLVEDMAKDFGI